MVCRWSRTNLLGPGTHITGTRDQKVLTMCILEHLGTTYRVVWQRWAKLLILVDFDVDIDNILEIDVEFDVWSDFDFGIEYCQANLQMLKLSTNLDMQLLNLEFES